MAPISKAEKNISGANQTAALTNGATPANKSAMNNGSAYTQNASSVTDARGRLMVTE